MATIFELLAIIIIIIATGFSIIGVIGFHRLPDVYSQLHATGKVGILGVVLLAIATAFVFPTEWGRVIILILLLLIGGPVAAHALASAAHRTGVPMQGAVRNDLDTQYRS
ncbi:MAG: monovalent cation/H(+) antiporter subunit G [Chloroflexota bacterium]